ncbi:Autophagy-related protein 18g [Acorus calamus]|uniref:Autophagy-related protein 18g n=1 Tax=Acorus calamus TaxID=4465 RepID=A0AAV9EV66_ACOCL|nr:Autophagy-related protein 18g [Acorus calamus]
MLRCVKGGEVGVSEKVFPGDGGRGSGGEGFGWGSVCGGGGRSVGGRRWKGSSEEDEEGESGGGGGGGGGGGKGGLIPNSLRIISSCLKTVSSNAGSVASSVRSAGASVAASISVPAEDEKDQVLWVGFDKLELGPSSSKRVLLTGYSNGFQVLDVEDASNVHELVSKRDGPVTFLQMQPTPAKSLDGQGFRGLHPLLLVVAGDETNGLGTVQGGRLSGLIRDGTGEPQGGDSISTPTVVRFYSLRSHNYVHVLRFRSAVYLVRCSSQIVAVALAAQIYCFDAVTLENKFSVLTYPMPQGGQGPGGVNIGYGPMAVGPRWLAYASNNPLLSNTGRLSPQNLTPSPGVSPSTSPSSGNLVARYAMESSKHLAAGIINIGDMGYKTLSKYCNELLPDGSTSPVLSHSSRKSGRYPSIVHQSEVDNAGMVVVKDVISKDVIAQFRAHKSPISALCFDPSGTLLVTASVHGNNINVFRIMPSHMQNGTSSARYDWTTSHVHLYKLYRGLTTAVIQDICFSHYSQWIAIVSSRGTCHIFTLSPFGGEAGLQTQSSHGDDLILVPSLTLPWWSTTSLVMDQQFLPPPPPITLSVVSRLKNGNSGWLNTVSNAAASATGKTPVPSGAIAATFHNSVYRNLRKVNLKANSLEHLLVYSPSGHVIQHELMPSLGIDCCDNGSRIGSSPLSQVSDEELRVIVEPVQWWDVCRRLNWPEREECISSISLDRGDFGEMGMDTSDCEDNDCKSSTSSNNSLAGKDLLKPQEKSHWYLSNAEVQISSGRLQIWLKSKVGETSNYGGGEIEIEKVPIQEIEIQRKDLLPVFEHFHRIHSDRNDKLNLLNSRNCPLGEGGIDGGRYSIFPSSATQLPGNKFMEEIVTRPSRPASVSSGDSLNVGSPCRPAKMQSVENANPHGISSLDNSPPCVGKSTGGYSINREVVNEVSDASSANHYASSANVYEDNSSTDSLNPQGFVQYFQEGYCKASELDGCHDPTEAVTDADSNSSHCDKEKVEEDLDNDDMLGGVFAFCEEDKGILNPWAVLLRTIISTETCVRSLSFDGNFISPGCWYVQNEKLIIGDIPSRGNE